ncbi:MAG: DUF637 domain-containing protein [Candidatus Paracaedibacteraceae bacterium]|nr:DUF637 domain-containing protein [Candidatus Paracaedibacteraceae bacterium]
MGTLEVQTPGMVLLQNCTIYNLLLESYSSLLSGGNIFIIMKASHHTEGGILVRGPKRDTIGSLLLVSGHLYNAGFLCLGEENHWDLGGNAFVNYGRLHIQSKASLQIKRSLAVLNLNKISGHHLKLATKYTPWVPMTRQQPEVLQADVDTLLTFYATAVSLATTLGEAGLVEESALAALKAVYPVLGGIINAGHLSVKKGEFYGTDIINHPKAVFKIAEASKFVISKFKNAGTAIIGKSTTDTNHYIPYLVNSSRFTCHSDLALDRLKTTSSSQIHLYNGQLLEIRSPFKLYGTLRAFDGLALKGMGENVGQLALVRKQMDEKDALKLIIEDKLINQGTLLSQTPLTITGKGKLENHKTVESPTLKVEVNSVQNDGLMNGDTVEIRNALLDNVNGDIHAAEKATIVTTQVKNNHGKIHAAEDTFVQTADLDNEGGSISGLKVTTLYSMSPQFTNKGGEIGAKGTTHLVFKHASPVEELGIVKGKYVYLHGQSPAQSLGIQNGIVAAEDAAFVKGKQFQGTNLDVQTPNLYLQLSSWALNDQTHCERTVWSCDPQQDVDFIHPYRTSGKFEIWWKNFRNYQEVVQEWTRLYRNASQPLPETMRTIRLKATIEADKGMNVYAPSATLEVPDSQQDKATELIFKEGNFYALIGKLDIERAVISALNFTSGAPHGNIIGRLIEDPSRIGLATFYSNRHTGPNCSNIGSYNAAKSCELFGKTVPNFYDGRHLQILPVYINNGTSLIIKQLTDLVGHMILEANLTTHDLTVDSLTLSKGTACSLDIAHNLLFKRGGGLQLDRVESKAQHHYYSIQSGYSYLSWWVRTYTHCHSDAASLEVQGKIDADRPTPLTLIGSTWYAQEVTPAIQHKDSTLTCSYFQKFYDREECDREGYLTAQYSGRIRQSGMTIAHNYHFPNPIENTRYAAPNSPHSYAVGFLVKTKNFEGAQSVFPSYKSASKGIIASTSGASSDQIMDASLSTPLMVVTIGGGKLALGSPNPYYIAPKNPIQDLMAKGFNLQTTYIAPNLKELIGQAHTKQILFKMHERFWFEQEKAEAFYRDIYDHVHIMDAMGVKKLNGPAIFSISPGFLVDRVRKSCQETLMRGYIEDHQAIDEACVQQLHRNASEYFSHVTVDPAEVHHALVTLASSGKIKWPEKPILFYTSLPNDQKVEELSPTIVYPLQMMQEARAERGGLSRIKTLAIFPESMTPQQMIEATDNPALQLTLRNHFENNPQTLRQLEQQAHQHQQRMLAYNPEGTPTTNDLSLLSTGSQALYSSGASSSGDPLERGSVSVYGTVRSDQIGILTEGPIHIQADIKAENAFLASLYDNVILESRKERLYRDAENFIEHIPVPARIAVQNILKIYSGQSVIMIGAQTDSGVMTHIKALADIIDVPVELLTQSIERYYGRKKNGMVQTNTSTVVASRHTSRGHITTESGNNTILQASQLEARQVDIVGGNNVEFRDAHNTRTVQGKLTGKGSWGKKKKHQFVAQTQRSVGVKIKADVLNVTAVTGNITITNPTFEAIETNLKAIKGLVSILLGVNTYLMQATKSSNSVAWNRMGQRTEEHTTYAQPTFTGKVTIESRDTLVQLVQGQANTFFDYIEQHGGALEKKFLSEFHKSEYKKVQGPGQALMAVIAVAMAMITGGAGAALAQAASLAGNATATAMFGAAVTSVATQFTVGSLQNGGNPLKGAKTLLNKDYLRGLAVSVVSAGVTAKIGGHYDIKRPDATMIQKLTNVDLLTAQLKFNLLDQAVNTTVRTTLGKESFKGAGGNLVKSVAVDTVAAFAANKIGESYASGSLSSAEQKALHFGVGFSMGLGLEGTVEAGLTAGTAAVLGEVMAEKITGDPKTLRQQACEDVHQDGKPLTEENINKAAQARRQEAAKWAKLGTAVTALATRTDVNLAVRAASNAVENNFLATSLLYQNSDNVFAEVFERNLEEEEKSKGEEAEERGRSREREPRSHQSKSQSPPRCKDASFEKFNQMMSYAHDTLYDGQKRFRNGERTMETFFKAHGAAWLDTFGYAVKGADFISGGAVTQLGKAMEEGSKGANTSIRRTVRDLTGNQKWGQEAGDYATFLGSFLIPGPGTVAKAAQVVNVGKITGATANLVRRIRMAEALDLAGISQAPTSKFIYQQYGKGHQVKKTLTRIANENRAPFTAQRSANANRFYDEMRAVANGGTTSRPTPSSGSSSALQMSSSKGNNGSSSMSRGSSASSSSHGSSSSARQGSSGGSSQSVLWP